MRERNSPTLLNLGESDAASDDKLPLEDVRPITLPGGLGSEILALVRYMVRTEVHTYAFSVAANVILSLFPFVVLLLTLTDRVFNSPMMESVVGQMMRNLLPAGGAFIMHNARPNKSTAVFSIVMLLISSTGVFLPLEVALNDVWGVKKNRNYLHNQIISLGLSLAVGVLAIASIAMSAGQQTILTWVFFGHTDNLVFHLLQTGMISILAAISSVLIFFLIYWILPYRKVPARSVLPTAIVVGVLWEVAKYLYILALPRLDFKAVYGPFQNTVGLMMWAFLSGLLLLGGAHFSATRYAISLARQQDADSDSDAEAHAEGH